MGSQIRLPAVSWWSWPPAAGVALDTVYAAVGAKPVLFRLLVETAIAGTEAPVPALERDYVRAIRAEPDPARKLAIYA